MGKTSVWPSDFLAEPHEIERRDANHLIVFLICPFYPKERFRELLEFCNKVCRDVGALIGANVECIRADSFATPKVIHEDIWSHIQMADAIIADVSGTNGNVMLELGVAAAVRKKEHVIVVHDQESKYKFLFDISPARHLSYRRGLRGVLRFQDQLTKALLFALAPAPYTPPSSLHLDFPINLDLTAQVAASVLLSPGNAHRRHTAEGLEFGSFYIFRYSWMTLGSDLVSAIKIHAEMKFSKLRPNNKPGAGWIGIMLRGAHFFANMGHLVYVVSNGDVKHTKPIDEFHKEDPDPLLGQISNFRLSDWISFDLQFDDSGIKGSVGDVDVNIRAQDMPYRYNAGILRFQTFEARAMLRRLRVDRLD